MKIRILNAIRGRVCQERVFQSQNRNIQGQRKPRSSTSITNTFGASGGAVGGIGHSGSEVEKTFPTFPPKFYMHGLYCSPATSFDCVLNILKTIFCLQCILRSFVHYSTFMANTPDEIVRSFCAKWADGNVKEIVNYFDENAIYHNIPMAPVNGVDEIRLFIEGFFSSAESIDFEILHQVASGNIVMNERIDTLVIGDATRGFQ